MPEHTVGTREEWRAARNELATLEAEQAEKNEEIKRKRLELPWVPVEKEYEFDTEDGKRTLAELFDGRSQLLAYSIMFGPDYTLGACPGCTNLADGLDGSLIHLNHRDVTLLCFSRAPIERLTAYKQRMGWEFPCVSTYNTDFAFDFGLALTEEDARQVPEIKGMIDNPPDWLEEWSAQIGAELKDGLRENPTWIAFARENGTVYHTYTVAARGRVEAIRRQRERIGGERRGRTQLRDTSGGEVALDEVVEEHTPQCNLVVGHLGERRLGTESRARPVPAACCARIRRGYQQACGVRATAPQGARRDRCLGAH